MPRECVLAADTGLPEDDWSSVAFAEDFKAALGHLNAAERAELVDWMRQTDRERLRAMADTVERFCAALNAADARMRGLEGKA